MTEFNLTQNFISIPTSSDNIIAEMCNKWVGYTLDSHYFYVRLILITILFLILHKYLPLYIKFPKSFNYKNQKYEKIEIFKELADIPILTMIIRIFSVFLYQLVKIEHLNYIEILKKILGW